MPKRLLDVGNCGPDHGAIIDLVQAHFDVVVVQAHGESEALAALDKTPFDLVTINRVMDRDGASGLDIIKAIKGDERLANTAVMLISNYAEYQSLAMAAGAEQGFGKRDLRAETTVQRLRPFLG
jgi:CheY-like chemotaxis protein